MKDDTHKCSQGKEREGGGGITRKGEDEQTRGKITLTIRRRRKAWEGGGTEM